MPWPKKRIPRRPTRKIEFIPVSFLINGKSYAGYMADVSVGGAKIRLHRDAINSVAAGQDILLNIKTPYGQSTCMAKIEWVRQQDSGCHIGVKFEGLSDNPKDPLRCVIDSAIC